MSTQTLEGFPADIVVTDPTEGSVTVTVDAAVYPLEAVYGAAFIFIDRCYVLLDRPKAGAYAVTLIHKNSSLDESSRKALVGELINELLTQAWRQKIIEENRVVIETVTTQALAGALAEPSLDDLASFDFSEDSFDDPLGIAMSWEEKYRKKTPTEAGGAETSPEVKP